MDITMRPEGEFLVVRVSGRLDTVTAPQFEEQCRAQFEQGCRKMILDFADLQYLSSAGLRSLLVMAKKAKALGGSLALCSLQGVVREIVTVSGFDSVLPLYADVASAVEGGA